MPHLDTCSLAAIEREVYEDERVLWTGCPDRVRFAWRAWQAVPMGALLAGIVVVWVLGATRWGIPGIDRHPGQIAVVAVPLLVAAAGLLVLPLWMWRKAGRLVYAITDTRAIVLDRKRPGCAQSFDAEDLRYVHSRQYGGGGGDIVFRPRGPYSTDSVLHITDQGFLGLDDLGAAEAALWQMKGFRKPLHWGMNRSLGIALVPAAIIVGLMGGMMLFQAGLVKTLTFTQQAGRTDCLVWKSWAGLIDRERLGIAGVQGAEGRLVTPAGNGDCDNPWYEVVIHTASGAVPVVGDDEVWALAKRINSFVAAPPGGALRVVMPAGRSVGLWDLMGLALLCFAMHLAALGVQVIVDERHRCPLGQAEPGGP